MKSGDDPKEYDGRRWEITRRRFVTSVGTVTGGIVLRLPVFGDMHPGNAVLAPDELLTSSNLVHTDMVINGGRQSFALDPRITLLDLLRESLGLTGTKKGCDHGQCGACTVLANGVRVNSCLSLAVTHDGDEITTIEGIARGEELHPIQAAFLEHDGLQCGYCTPGQICSAVALLREAKNGDASAITANLSSRDVKLTPDEIRERMSGNICRCGAYPGIVAAVQEVSQAKTGRSNKS